MVLNFKKPVILFVMIFHLDLFNARADSSSEGDIAYGEYLSSECVTCHQASGGSQQIPSITGWDAADFVDVINLYKNKERSNQVMQLVTSRLTDKQIASLAVYFATLRPAK